MPSPPRPPYDPELEQALPRVHAASPGPIRASTIEDARRSLGVAEPAHLLAQRFGIRTSDHTVPGRTAVDVTVFEPHDPIRDRAAFLYLHGGGLVLGDRLSGIDAVLDWVTEFSAVVITVEYRLAPEHPSPAALEDGMTALRWLADAAEDLGVDPNRIFVAGTSAGGGLAAAIALRVRDTGGPPLAGQVLICPMLDARNDTVSARQFETGGLWDRRDNEAAWTAALGSSRLESPHLPAASPAVHPDLTGLPSAYLEVGSAEVFRDEVVAYASRMWEVGGTAELHVWAGGFHGFTRQVPDAPVSREARRARLAWLRRALEANRSAR